MRKKISLIMLLFSMVIFLPNVNASIIANYEFNETSGWNVFGTSASQHSACASGHDGWCAYLDTFHFGSPNNEISQNIQIPYDAVNLIAYYSLVNDARFSLYLGNNLLLNCNGCGSGYKTFNITAYRGQTLALNITDKDGVCGGGVCWAYIDNITITTSDPVNVSDCGILSEDNTIYNLISNITDTNENICFTIEGANITLDCNYNTIDGDKIDSNYGIMADDRYGLTVKNCIISDMTDSATYFKVSNGVFMNNILIDNNNGISADDTSNSLIYNNFFNNTRNVNPDNGNVQFNYNTTKQLGTRIYGNGNYIGGNYWTNSTGNGYSDICDDLDQDGFCDQSLTLAVDNIDYLPLSNEISICTPMWTLNSTQNQCFNSTNYQINTTYYDTNECEIPPYLSNYTYPILQYNFTQTINSCNGSSSQQTFYYNDTLTCGYSFSNFTQTNCTQGCFGGICISNPAQNVPFYSQILLILGFGILALMISGFLTQPKGIQVKDFIMLIIAVTIVSTVILLLV